MGLYLNGKLVGISLPQSGGGDIITATNIIGSSINKGDKVWLEEKTSGGIRNFETVNESSTYMELDDASEVITFKNRPYSYTGTYGKIYKTYPVKYSLPKSKVVVQILCNWWCFNFRNIY